MWTFSAGVKSRTRGFGEKEKLRRVESGERAQRSSHAAPCVLVLAGAVLAASGAVLLESGARNLKPVLAAGGLYEVREIRPHIFVWLPEDVLDQEGDPEFSRAGTAGFIVTTEGVVVVDTTNSPFHARELLFEIRTRTDAPVEYVIDTDPEGDHTLGNEVFVDQQASILATPSTQAEMRRYQLELPRRLAEDWRLQARMRGFHPTLPQHTFEGERVLRFERREPSERAGQENSQEIKLLSFKTGPASADAAVYLPAAKVMFLGALFENGYFPHLGSRPQPRDILRWIEVLRELETWNVDVYVPGHGPPGGKKELIEFRQFLEWLRSQVEARVKLGKSLEQVEQELSPPLENYHWHAPELRRGAVEAAYTQLAAARGASSVSPGQPGSSPSGPKP
jgi:glyoxylase-like metal-dependent hydrolase (beta-lactamase superfamily II)